MKKVMLGIFLLAFVAVGSYAQDQETSTGKRHRGPQDMTAQLNLSDEQKSELKAIREDYQKQMENIRKEHRDKVQNLLTDDQKANMKKIMEEQKGKKQDGRKGGRHHNKQDFDKMKKDLNLTDDQVTALKKNREESFSKMKALRADKSKTEEQRKTEMKEFRKQQHESLKSILNEEQLQKLQQKKSHRQAPVQS